MMRVGIALFLGILVAPAFALEAALFEADSAAGYFDGAEQKPCTGRPAALYLNQPDPQGSYQGYREAVRANAAWLAAKGYDDVELSTFITRGPDDVLGFGNLIVYPDEARYLETRRNRPSDRDQAFEEFVAAYGRNTLGSIRLLLCLEAP